MESESKHKHRKSSHKSKKKKKHKKHKKRYSSSSDDSSSQEEWIEKPTKNTFSSFKKQEDESSTSLKRDSWMTNSDFLFPTTSSYSEIKKDRIESQREAKRSNTYDPRQSVRELNPYWKDGGDGLPSIQRKTEFKKPSLEGSYDHYNNKYSTNKSSGDWRKKNSNTEQKEKKTIFTSEDDTKVSEKLSEQHINELAAKVLKAEIMGNTELHQKLKAQLEAARATQANASDEKQDMDILLTTTNNKGQSAPLQKRSTSDQSYSSRGKEKRKKVETHEQGQRVRYFPDDDRHSLQNMFEREKFNTGNDDDETFMKLSAKMKNPNDDLEDIFAEKVQKSLSDEKTDEINRRKVIQEHQRLTRSLETCCWCLDSPKFAKELLVSTGENVYLALPSYRSIVPGHCFLAPIRHVPCATQLDEDVWAEMQNFRKAIANMFLKEQNSTTIFYECAMNLNKYPHMIIECVPLPDEAGSLAPMYFKKAILECEQEWSMNKKLVELKGSNVRRAIPRGLSYFSVEFDAGSRGGYAHVIEDRKDFPKNFAQEVIGGILDLDHSLWRKPQRENKDQWKEKLDNFVKMWKKYDITK